MLGSFLYIPKHNLKGEIIMSIPNYLTALANHKGPATVNAGGLSIPVKIGNINYEDHPDRSDLCTFECLVVNVDQIRPVNLKAALNAAYSPAQMNEYTRQALAKATNGYGARKNAEAIGYAVHDVAATMAAHNALNNAKRFEIKKVYFNDPVTVVLWADGTKTVVKCQEGDVYSKETGLALCFAKKALGNKGNFNDIFHKWIPEEEKPVVLPTEVLCVTPGEDEEENADE